MRVTETELPGVLIIEADQHADERGHITVAYHGSEFAKYGITEPFVQTNCVRSSPNTLRGLHYQLREPQAKLCSVLSGRVIDVVADIRPGSQTRGQCLRVELYGNTMIYIPAGYAHGFYVPTNVQPDGIIFMYQMSRPYSGLDDQLGVRWDDPQLAIPWKCFHPLLSKKDQELPFLEHIPDRNLPS